MPIKLTAAQYKVIAIAVIVAAVSLGISVRYFSRAFPEASLDLRVNRDDSARIASKFLAERGLRPDGYRHATIFDYDDDTKIYLERTQGLERMNQLTSGAVRLWLWSHRWFLPQQKEEFRVDVTPAGEVAGFAHEIPETRAGANLDAAGARAIAEVFLSQAMKRDLGDMEFLESESIKRPARTDHVFTWKQKSVLLGDGSLRVAVAIQGDQVARYREFVQIPEEWSREYEKLRSRNASAQIVDEVFYALLTVAMLVILVLRLRDHDVPLRTSLAFGVVAAILYFLGQANTFSLAEYSYPTTDPYSGFLANYFTRSALNALGVGVFVFIVVAAAEPVYRQGFPVLISLRRYFTWRGLRTRSFFLASVVGLALAFFFFAYQTVFYLAAGKWGAWAPADVPFTNDLNTRVPWLAVLFMGFFPAISEEMQFRAFAIPFLAKYVRSWPLAVLLAAFNWGFLHSTYPNQPFYIRGVEVGVGGILIGFVMMRFGIVATLIWHYSVDALYSAFLLLRSPNHYLMASGAITAGMMLVPLVVALVAYRRTGTFQDESALTNAQEGVSRPPRAAPAEESPSELAYRPLSRRRLVLAGILAAIFLAVAIVPVFQFGESLKIRITARDAIREANAYLERQRIDTANYRPVARLLDNVDRLAVRYFLERRSLRQADQIYRRATQMAAWEVRYFRPLKIEEHRVYIDATSGQFVDHRLELDENAPGAALSLDAARALSEKAMAEHGYRLSEFELQDARGEKRKAREDYTFVWQAKPGDYRNVGDEHYRVRVNLAGDQIASVGDSFHLPEEWVRQRQTTRLANAILTGFVALFAIIVVIRALFLFVAQVRHARFPWRAAAGVGAVLAIVTALSELNRLSSMMEQGYSTSISLSAYWLRAGASLLFFPILVGLSVWVLVAFALSLYPEAQRLLRRSGRDAWRRDALVAILLGLAASAALSKLRALAALILPAAAPLRINLAPGALDSWSPALAYFSEALLAAVVAAAVAGVAISMIRSAWSGRDGWFWGAMLLLLVVLGPSSAHSLSEFWTGWTLGALSLAVAGGIVAAFFRDNALAYPAAAFSVAIANPIEELLSQPAPFYRWNGLLLAVLALMVVGWMLRPSRRVCSEG
jgi:membrane protease YdiL (CAAX protease family)